MNHIAYFLVIVGNLYLTVSAVAMAVCEYGFGGKLQASKGMLALACALWVAIYFVGWPQ